MAAAIVLVFAPIACAGGDGALDTAEAFREWLLANRDHVGLVAMRLGTEPDTLALNADTRFPLASTRKVLILGTYAEQVASGKLNPRTRVPVAEIERWYWPTTDGGAHEHATDEWNSDRRITNGSVILDDVARAHDQVVR